MATIKLTNPSNGPGASGRATEGASVRFDKPNQLQLTADEAQQLLTRVRAQITIGGTVQTGYLSLQKNDKGEFTLENRSRLNAFGDKAGAAALVKSLIQTAYGDRIGHASSQALQASIDHYLADKSFGKKLGTVSFVRLLNDLEVNAGGVAAADRKSSLQSLLGAGGSLAVDAAGIAKGAREIQEVHQQVDTLTEATQGLMRQDAADSIPAALAQLTARSELAARITEGYPENRTLLARAGELDNGRAALATKLNADLSARVDRIRPAAQTINAATLRSQITGLRALKGAVEGAPSAPAGPVTAVTRQKIDDALTAAEQALADQAAVLRQGALELRARTLALMGERVDGSGAASTYAFDAHALPDALRKHRELSAEIDTLRNLDPVLFATSVASLEEVRSTLTAKINQAAIAAAETPAAAAAPANTGDPLMQRLVQLQGLQAALASDPSGALAPDTRSRVAAAAETALSMIGEAQVARLQARLTALQSPSGLGALVEPRPPTLGEQALKSAALNDLLQVLGPLVSQPGMRAEFAPQLRTLATNVRDESLQALQGLRDAINDDFGRHAQTPPTAEHRAQRSEALHQLSQQAARLNGLLGPADPGDANAASALGGLALAALHLQDAKSWFRPQGDAALTLIAGIDVPRQGGLEQDLLILHGHGLLRIPAFTEGLGKVTGTEPGLAWIGELARGEALAVDSLLNRPEWDELALQMKRRAAGPPGADDSGGARAQALAQIELDHQIHVSKRALDGLLRAANPDWGFSATTLKDIQGNQAKRALVDQGMQSMVFDTQTVKALVSARDQTKPPLNVAAFNLVLAKTIALQTAGAAPTPESRAQAARLLRLMLPATVTDGKSDAQLVDHALDNISSKSTDDLLQLADQLGTLASDIGGRSVQLLAALQAFDTQTDGPRTRASQLVVRLTQDVVKVGASMAANISAAGGEASNAHLLASAFGRELSQVRASASATTALNGAVEALRSAGNLEAIDLSAVRQLMVPLVAQGETGRSTRAGAAAIVMGAGTTSGALKYYFDVESGDMRTGGDLIEVGQRIRNNVESHALDRMFVKNKLLGGYEANDTFTDRFAKLESFLSQSANFGDGHTPAGIRAGVVVQMRDGLARLASTEPAQRGSIWVEFQNQFSPPVEGQPPGASKNAGRLLRELFAGLKTAVEKQNPAATAAELTSLGQRYIALVDIGQRNAEIQQAATGLRSSHTARTAATKAVSQLDGAAPAMKKMAMLVMLDQFVSSDMRDMNHYRAALLTRDGQGPSALEVQLQARFQALLPPGQEGVDALVHICKGLLASKEDAHLLLKDLEADGSLPAREGPKAHQAPKAVRELLVREALGQRLGEQVSRLTSGQAMTVRGARGGGLSVGIPTPAGVDLTVGFSAEREHSVVIGKDTQGGFTVLCKAGTKTNSSLGIAAFAKTLSAKLDLGASVAGGFELAFESAQAATEFVTRMFTEPGPGTDPLTFMNAAARARVLNEVGASVSANVKVGAEVEVPGDLLGLSASFEASAQVGAGATYTHSTQRTAFESVQTSRVTWGFSAEVTVGVEFEGQAGEVATEVRDALGAGGLALQARGQAALDSVQARAEGVSGQDLDARVASGLQAANDRDFEKGGDLLSASTQRQQTSERRVVTRHGAVHPDTCIREGFRDSARSQVSVLGKRVWADDPFSKRIAELVRDTALADNPAFQSKVNLLRSMAQGNFELVLQRNLRQDVAVQIGTLRRDGGRGEEVERLLAERSSYELHSLELGYERLATDASGLSSANTQQGKTVGVPESVLPDAKISAKRWSDANLRSTETVLLGPLLSAPGRQAQFA